MQMNAPKSCKNSLTDLLFEEKMLMIVRKELSLVIKWPICDMNHFILMRHLLQG